MNINQVSNRINDYQNNDLGLLNKTATENSTSFTNYLTDAIDKVNESVNTANTYSIKLASGELDNIHEAMIASQKAEISFQFMTEVRNKVLDAYREIMRMQI